MARVLILCPTFNHVDTLYVSLASAQARSFTDWTLTVIGDGAPERTGQIVAGISAHDPRISYAAHPKSERYGEVHRDSIIRKSDAEIICHLGDDDIWSHDHLETLINTLEGADWASVGVLDVNTRAHPA